MNIYLHNEQPLDIDFIKLMGVNVKSSEGTIGQFGTGLKYAIAVFLREGIVIDLLIGGTPYNFTTETKTLRGKSFDICCLNGPYDHIDLSFTTELGKNWKLWQAYREIHSNCLDENGTISYTRPRGKEAGTLFILRDIDIDVDSIFINKADKNLVYSNKDLEIYEGQSDCIFYKGIRAKELKSKSKYTYNIMSYCQLTEDRLICYDWELKEAINNAIVEMCGEVDDALIEPMVTETRGHFENELSMDTNLTRSGNIHNFLGTINRIRTNGKRITYSAHMLESKHQPKQPKTRDQQKREFESDIITLCEDFGVTATTTMQEDGDKTIVIEGGILKAKP